LLGLIGTFALLEDYNSILIMLFYVSQDQVGERANFCPKMLSEYFCMQEKCKEKNVRDVQNLKFAKKC
jgi:hypothetical protein